MAVAEAESAEDGVCSAEVARVKFLCSFGGSIMPRPLDGRLRYVGGETRIVSVPMDVKYEDLMKRMRELYDEVTVVKYQQPDEDLDALVSVVNDEDLINMMEEYDKLGAGDGFTKLRIFLFSEGDEDVDPLFGGGDEDDRRYVDALNNVIDGFEYWRPQWGDSPRWSDSPRMSSVDAAEPYLPVGLEGGYASPRYYEILTRLNTNHHASPRYNSNQVPTCPRYNDLESPWGQASYSPRHHGYIDYQSPHSAVGYNMPYGEYPDNRMTGEYRCQPVAQPPMFEQMPRYQENVVRIPPGTLTNHRAGFPDNVLKGTNVFEGNVECEDNITSFQRSRPEMGHSVVVNGFQQIHIPTVEYPSREPGSLFHDQLDMPAYIANSPHNHPAEGHYHVQPGHSSIQRNNQCHTYCNDRNVGAQVHDNTNPGYPKNADNTPAYSVQANRTENLAGSMQEYVGLDASSMLEYPHGNTLKLNTKVGSTVSGRPPPILSRSDASQDTLNSSGSSTSQLEKRDGCSLERVEKSIFQEEDRVAITAQENVGKDSQRSSYIERNVRGEEHGMVTDHNVHFSCLKSKEKHRNNSSQNDIVSDDSINAFPESEAVAMAVSSVKEINRLLEQNLQPSNDAKLEEESAKEMENLSLHQNLEWISENEKISKIEPTKAEAEAISRGLQTIKTADLEEIRELGRGTYGSVYHGKWKGCDVAVKRIKASCFEGKPSERERLIAEFWNEALLLSLLHHPNVVAFYGIVRDGPDGSLATVTEFMINGSLKQFLKKKDRTIDRRKRLIIAMDASFGMEYLHGKNVVHFDLKCENLLVNMRDPQRPICKIGDLGLSKVKQRTQVSGGIRGTLPWMAPELLSGKNDMVSDKIDVYSFGVVMWELLTGDEPYADMHYGSIIGGIVNNSLRPQIPTWCDPEWKSLMESCWASDPAARPSFSEVSQKLRTMATAMNIK